MAAALAQAPSPAGKPPAPKSARSAESRPAWAELNVEQQQALRPLAPTWSTLGESHKRKWIALVANYRKLSPAEQAKLTSRMTEWAALSPQQRAQARLNFGEAKTVPADERKAKWEAYQALSPEEKRKLAAGAPAKTPPTAAGVRPVPPQKLATVPRASRENRNPRIVAGPVHQPASHPEAPGASPAAPAPQAN
jgi:hypothetical protein